MVNQIVISCKIENDYLLDKFFLSFQLFRNKNMPLLSAKMLKSLSKRITVQNNVLNNGHYTSFSKQSLLL